MVSEGVDIPRLRVGVFATNTTTELFFRQAVGRIVRWTPGVPRQQAYMFMPDDPRLRLFARGIAEQRRHSLRRRVDDDAADRTEGELDLVDLGDDEQMSLFAVIGSVALDTEDRTGHHADAGEGTGVFGDDPDGEVDHRDDPGGVDLILLPPPLPGGGLPSSGADAGNEVVDVRRRKIALRDSNAELARDLVRSTGWSHPQVNAELNRLAGIRKISEATTDQLERRLVAGRKWLRAT